MSQFNITEVDGSILTLQLDRGFELSPQRETKEGLAITVTYADRRIALRERNAGTIEAEGDHTYSDKERVRTGKKMLGDAIEWAVKQLHTVVRTADLEASPDQSSAVPTGAERTLGQAYRFAYDRRVWSHCSPDQQDTLKRKLDILYVLFGPEKRLDVPWDQSDVDLYFAARCGTTRNGRVLTDAELRQFGLEAPGLRFPEVLGRRDVGPVKPITAKNGLKDIKTLFEYLRKENFGEHRFIEKNPLADLDLGNAVRGNRAEYHRDRFKWLLASADYVDPTGRLRLVLVLAFLTGHRIGAILGLEKEHLGLNTRRIRELLRQVRSTSEVEPDVSESWAEDWANGAIYWVKENDKENFDRVVPISERVRSEIDLYLERRKEFLGNSESPWLFPQETSPQRHLIQNVTRRWLRAAEEFSRPHIRKAGYDPDEIMPETPGDAFHPARSWWEVRHSELNWGRDPHSAYVGGWTCNTGHVQSTVYGKLNPKLLQACVDGLTYEEAAEKLGLTRDAKAALDPDVPELEIDEEQGQAA